VVERRPVPLAPAFGMAKRDRPRDLAFSPWLTVLKVLGVVVLAALILAGAYFYARMGPQQLSYVQVDALNGDDIPKDALDSLERSRVLWRKFQETQKMRDITPDDLTGLRQAILLDETYLKRTGRDVAYGDDRLTDMRQALQVHESEPIYKDSLELEQQAQKAEHDGQLEDASRLLRQAMDLQTKIDTDYRLSKYQDMTRQLTMGRHLDYLAALPLSNESLAAEKAAVAAIAARDWPAALANYQKAHDLQVRLNTDYREQQFANSDREQRLAKELASLDSIIPYQKIQLQLIAARSAAATGDPLHAAELFQDAQRQQRELLQNYPGSRFADAAVVDQIEIERQTALSRPVADEIRRQAATLAGLLRDRRVADAQAAVPVLAEKIAAFREQWPRSDELGDDLEQRVQYVNFKRDDLARIQDLAFGKLAPLPNQSRWQLYKQEVPQSFYQFVMGGNPSRNTDPNLPVEMVSWPEAKDFCHHLEWVLARPVRLPTIDEFRAAVGSTASLDVMGASWNMDNSSGKTQAVASKAANAAGFYDLLGNVAEWLEQSDKMLDDTAPVAGGYAGMAVDKIREVPVEAAKLTDHSRYTGFRFIVDMDSAAPIPGLEQMATAPAALPTLP